MKKNFTFLVLPIIVFTGVSGLLLKEGLFGKLIEIEALKKTTRLAAGLAVFMLFLSTSAYAQAPPCTGSNVGGQVWRDFNNDGILDATEISGVANVTVTAFDGDGVVETVTTDELGRYTFTTLSFPNTYRIEFSALPAPYLPTFHEVGGSNDVQFVDAPACDVNYGVNAPTDYCQDDPYVVTACYVGGDNTGSGDVLVGVPYNQVGAPAQYAVESEIGSTWGLAYNRTTNEIYSAAVVKRHAGLGPNGIGAIYKTDATANTSALHYDFGALAGTIGSNAARGLSAPGDPSYDTDAFLLAGKAGLGDLDISSDESTLWVVNLNDGKLYSLDADSPAPGSAIAAPAIPSMNCPVTVPTITSQLIDCGSAIPAPGYLSDNGTWGGDIELSKSYGGPATLVGDEYPYRRPGSVFNYGTPTTNTTSFSSAALANCNRLNSNSTQRLTQYAIPVPNGTYQVDMGFNVNAADLASIGMDVIIEDVTVLSNYTMAAALTAQEETYTATVNDGVLNILFENVVGKRLIINAIRVTQLTSFNQTPVAVQRPWGIKVYNDGTGDKIFVGVVCSAEQTGNFDDMTANVMVYDPAAGTWSGPVLSFPLHFAREKATLNDSGNWLPWTSSFSAMLQNVYSLSQSDGGNPYAQPIISDIEFDDNGDMILGMLDRGGLQFGITNYRPLPPYGPGGTQLMTLVSSGDIMRAGKNSNTSWTIENDGSVTNAVTGTQTSTSVAPNAGPGGNEFYWGENYSGAGHQESSFGGLGINHNFGEIIHTALDASKTQQNAGGLQWLFNHDGSFSYGIDLYDGTSTGTFAKAVGLGDLELLCFPAPLQIGNLVWNDLDRDGVLDPGESVVEGVTVSLYLEENGVLTYLANTTTSAGGEYYFTGLGTPGENWTANPGFDYVMPNTNYVVVFGYDGTTSQFSGGQLVVAGETYNMTIPNTGIGSSPDQNDSDATLMTIDGNSYPSIALTTGIAGATNLTYDAGFWVCPTITNPSAAQTLCEGGAGEDITVNTDQNPNNGIRFVRFDSDQTATNGAETAAELSIIYAGGSTLATVTPIGASDPYTATLTAATAAWDLAAPGVYYVYAIMNPDGGAVCRPVQEIIVTIVDKPDLSANDLTVCETALGAGATVDLVALVQNPDGATLTFTEGGNPVVQPLAVGAHTISVTGASSLAGCSTTVTFTVTVQTFPTPTTICPGQSFTLTAPAGITNVTWYRDGTSVGSGITYAVTIPGSYSFTGDGPGGCSTGQCCPITFEQGDCMSVGSTVWFDNNNNGQYDQSTELPIPGVTVELYDAITSMLVGTDVTDSNGDYYFGNLPAGTYFVLLPAANFSGTGALINTVSSTTPTDGDTGTDNNDNGTQLTPNGVVQSLNFVLVPDMEPEGMAETGSGGIQDNGTVPTGFPDTNQDDDGDMTIDFGFVPLMSVGSTVFIDNDNDGLLNNTDAGIMGVSLQLFNADGSPYDQDPFTAGVQPYMVTTDGSGNYLFSGVLPGNYYISIVTPPTGYPLSSTPTDTDANNQQDGDDNGIQTEINGVTNSAVFSLIPNSEPIGGETGQGGTQDDGIFDGNGDMTIDFGFTPAMSIGSTVYYDNNANGAHDMGEAGIEGVTVELLADLDGDGMINDVVATVITDGNGDYYFGGLAPGDYIVQVTPNAAAGASSPGGLLTDDMAGDGVNNGTQVGGPGTPAQSPVINLTPGMEPTAGDEANPQETTGTAQDNGVDANGDMTVDFGFVPMMSLGSTVFLDSNDNGVQDLGEEGIENITVYLFADVDGNGMIDPTPGGPDEFMSQVTDGQGNYYFDMLAPGEYIVAVAPSADTPLSSTDIATTGNENVDSNDDGIQAMAGDLIVSGPVTLVPGMELEDEAGQGGAQDAANDANGDMTIDFGLVPIGSIGSTVFIDENNNGMQDAGDAGIQFVTVELYLDTNMDGVPDGAPIATTVTGTDGLYIFENLLPGNYVVGIPTVPAAYQLSSGTTDNTENADNNDNGIQDAAGDPVYSGTIVLTAGNEPTTTEDGFSNEGQDDDGDPLEDSYGDMTVDFGFTPAVSVGSTVFLDNDNNGFQDGGEPGIPGVVIQLFDDMDMLIATDTTDSNGNYFFGGLFEGEYYIVIPAAENFGAGDALAETPLSSVLTDDMDNGEDQDDNGIQTGGQGTNVQSPNFVLEADTEQEGEVGQGGTQDSADDNNGDMTIDFGFPPLNFDLALRKSLATGQLANVQPGDTVLYTITVINQGNLAADNIVVTDYIPANMTFESGITANAAWTAGDITGPGQVNSLTITTFNGADSLAVGASVSVDIALTITSPLLPQGTSILNYAEISAATDEFGTTQDDIDSTPDDTNEEAGEFVDDNAINGNGNLAGEDEDDHDVEGVVIDGFDLALIKLLSDGQASAVAPGDTVSFTIRVINQGMIAADNIIVTDYLPADGSLIYDGTIAGNGDANWMMAGTNVARTLTVAAGDFPAGGLLPGDSTDVQINLVVANPLASGLQIDNFAEISGATDENGDPQDDIDSTPDGTNDDTLNQDNEIGGNALNIEGEDEDDHDIASITTLRFDLALAKRLSAGQSAMVNPGDDVSYDITVYNQGEIGADNILITDLIPTGMTYSVGGNTETWMIAGSSVSLTLVAGDQLPAGGLAPGESATVSIVLNVTAPVAAGTTFDNVANITSATDDTGDIQIDEDSDYGTPETPGDIAEGDNDELYENGEQGGDEDESDEETITINTFDLALRKTLADPTMTTVEPGDNVIFNITVYNQGDIVANNIQVTDLVPTGFTFNAADNPNWDGTNATMPTYTVVAGGADGLLAAAGLLPNGEVTVPITLMVNAPQMAGMSLRNVANITTATDLDGTEQIDDDSNYAVPETEGDIADTDDDEIDEDGTMIGQDEDESDFAVVTIEGFDLALIKVLGANQNATVAPGADVTFTIRVLNQGMVAADNILVTDYLPTDGTLIFNPANNTNWALNGNGDPERTISVANTDLMAGGLMPGDSAEVQIVLTLANPLPSGLQIDNFAEISAATDEAGNVQQDVDSTPDDENNDTFNEDNEVGGDALNVLGEDEDDHDIASIMTARFDLALRKVLSEGESANVNPGDEVSFDLVVFNQGEISADNIVLEDMIPAGFTYDQTINTEMWTLNGTVASLTLTAGNQLPATGLAVGARDTVTIVLRVDDPLPAGTQLNNVANIVSATDNAGGEQIDDDSNYADQEDGDDIEEDDDNQVLENGEEGGDEDESDEELVTVNRFDLALRKTVATGQSANVESGDGVVFDISIFNQGDIAADSITIIDFIQPGFTFDETLPANEGWTATSATTAEYTLAVGNADMILGPNGLEPNSLPAVVQITLTVDPALPGGLTLRNVAEIMSAEDNMDNDQIDDDSNYTDGITPDLVEDNDNDEIDEDGTITGEDEDESDFAEITTNNFDLALIKILSPNQPSVVAPGDTVAFTIRIINQGSIAADNILLTDYLDDPNLSYDGTVAGNDAAGWMLNTTSGDVERTLTVLNNDLDAGGLAPGDSTSVEIFLTIANPLEAGLEIVNTAEIGRATNQDGILQFDDDSQADQVNTDTYNNDNDVSGDGNNGEDEDDSDRAFVTTARFDLALRKTLADPTMTTVEPGDNVEFNITVYNQGDIVANNIQVTDLVPTGFTFNAADNPNWDGTNATMPTYTVVAGGADGLLGAAGLAPNGEVTVPITLMVNAPQTAGMSLRNVANIIDATDLDGTEQIDDDSNYAVMETEGDIADSDDNEIDEDGTMTGQDEDESDFEEVVIESFDLALIKELAPGQSTAVMPGDTVRYTITIFNQGEIAADNIEITDYVPGGMTFEMGAGDGTDNNLSLGWMDVAGNPTTTLTVADMELPTGGLMPGSSVTVDIFLTVDNPIGPGLQLDNFAEISGATDDNNMPQDDIDSAYDTDPTDDDLTEDNNVNGNGNTPGDDDDDHDIASVTTVEFDLALIKQLADGQSMTVNPGDTVIFTISILNQGSIAADNILISDYIATQANGFIWDPTIPTNADNLWMQNGNISADTLLVQTTLTDFNGMETLAPSASVTVDIALVVDPNIADMTILTNLAEISNATDDEGVDQIDTDSPMDEDPYNDEYFQDNEVSGDANQDEDEDNSDPATVIVGGGFDLALIKTIAPGYDAVVSPGDTIAFQIRVINQGAITADNIGIADYVPNGLTFDAALNPNWVYDELTMIASDTLTVADGDLSGAGLAPLEEEVVTIFLIVEPPLFPEYVLNGGTMPADDGVEPGESLVNTAEISYATDDEGIVREDTDSTPDSNNGNDGVIEDNEENGTGPDNNDDEDDHDIAVITVNCYADAGLPNIIQVCLGCDAAEVIINFMDALNGSPNVGGTWSDDFGTGVDLSDPENVPISGTLERPGIYEFTYTFPAINDCPARTATLRVEIINIENLTCSGLSNISLGEDCEAEVTPDVILQGSFPCFSVLEVNILDENGVSIGNIVGSEQIGQTLQVQLIDPMCDNFCWGLLKVEDKKRPVIECPAPPTDDFVCTDADVLLLSEPMTYRVNADGEIVDENGNGQIIGDEIPLALANILDITGYPLVTDNCLSSTVTVSDVITTDGDCGLVTITRTFAAVDDSEYANVAFPCTQTITIRKPTVDDLIFPAAVVEIPCDIDYETLPNGNPTSAEGGVFTINTVFATHVIAGNGSYCNIGASYSDSPVLNVCANGTEFIRTWTVIDWCTPGSAFTFTQLIKVMDNVAPTMTCPTFDNDEDGEIDATVIFSTSPFACTATLQVPMPTNLADNCSAGIAVTTVIYEAGTDAFVAGIEPGAPRFVTGLPIGNYYFHYIAEDACGNQSTLDCPFTVADLIEPTASCVDMLNVSIGGGDTANDIYGEARIFASDVNEGSNDNCGEVTVQVRRNYWANGTCADSEDSWSPWGDFVDFYCCDINRPVTLEMLVTDPSGNTNMCWMTVLPEDKLNPFCYAPEDVSLTCADLPLAFPGDIQTAYDEDFVATSIMMSSIFGGATGTDNCAVDTIVERTPNIQVNDCGWGSITRRFEAWQLRPAGDANNNGAIDINEVFRSTNSCSQVITITEVHDFVIDFPEDADADCSDPDVPTIITDGIGCDVLSVNIGEPVIYSTTGDECYKLSITYDVINWCVWDGEYDGYVISRMTEDDGEPLPVDRAVEGNERPVVRYSSATGLVIDRTHLDRDGNSTLADASPQLPNYGRYIYTQFVKVYDSMAPVVSVGEYGGPTANCPDLLPGQFGDDDGNCEEAVSIPFSVSDECELFDGAGNLVISLVSAELDAFAVDANGDGDIKSNEFVAETGAAGNVLANITDNGDGTYLFTGTFPIITSVMGDNIYHAVRILFEDGCGNQTSETIVFDVIDCKGPAPVCINGLTVTLMPQEEGGCAMAIWAADFEASPIYDCTGQGPETNADGQLRVTSYAIYRASEVEADTAFVPNPDDTGLILTQADDQNTVVYVYAFDEEGNYDYCETYILVQLHVDCADGEGTIAGVIATENSETVEGVEVSINGGMTATMTTNTTGTYSFSNLALGGDYSVTPYLNTNPLNGVTTFDIVKISKHILNVEVLNSPYKIIAADANRSGSVTTLDLIQIRKLVLNIITEFPNNTSWRFVAADYDFPESTNPWYETFPELINENNLVGDVLDADFVGVKIGDVNGSAQANALASDDRTLNGTFNLKAEDIDMKAGNTYTVAITADNLQTIEGFQGTLQLSGVELVDIEYGAATAEHFGLPYASEGAITMSWNHNSSNGTTSEYLFSLVIRPIADTELSNAIRISSRYTVAEAYRAGELTDLGIEFTKGWSVAKEFVLYQNTPNPFAATTLIGFNLPEDATATITINDVSGRVLTIIKGDYAAGYNTINVTKQMIQGATGVLSYTVEAGEHRATKRMIVVD